jgi:transposase
MLSKEDFAVIQALRNRGVYQKDIARQVGVNPKTVNRALARGRAPNRPRRPRGSKLDPYKPFVDELLAEDVWNAVVILREIQARGYTGGITLVRLYVGPKRGLRPGKATVRFETRAGQQLQSDWSQTVTLIAGKRTRVYFQVNQLAYSRRFHFWCTDSQDAEHTYDGLIRGFEYFGGVPQEVLVDNQKAAVVSPGTGGRTQFNSRFVDLAGHYGFVPRACRPYRARTKGKGERAIGYVKQHFFVRYRSFESWEHLNQLAELWLAEEADQRVHGTVREVVAERFSRELPLLSALPAARYDTSYHETRQVGWDGYIDVSGNRYSVPSGLAGRTVLIHIGLDGTLRVYHGEEEVTTHRLRDAAEGWVTQPQHHAELWRISVQQRPLDAYQEAASWS